MFQNVSVDVVMALTFLQGVTNRNTGVSRCEIQVFDPQAWHLAGIHYLRFKLTFWFYQTVDIDLFSSEKQKTSFMVSAVKLNQSLA